MKTVGNILFSPLGLIDEKLGQVAQGIGLAVVGVTTGNLGLVAVGLGRIAGAFASKPRPETSATAIRTPRPARVSAYGRSRLFPAIICYETAANGTSVDIGAYHDGEIDGIEQFYLNDEAVGTSGGGIGGFVLVGGDGRYGGDKVSIQLTDGSSPGAGLSTATSLLPGIWSSGHRGDGVVLAALFCAPVKQEEFLKIYPNGVPSLSLVSRWQLCPDFNAPDPTDESGWTWTENVIRQLGHYKLVREGVDYATKIEPALEFWQAAQDICDEAIALKAGGTEPRWRSCVAHKHTDTHKAVNAALLAACDGWISPRADGALAVYAGKFQSPTVSIGGAEVLAFEWDGVGVDDDIAANEIVCSYISAPHGYTAAETDPWVDEDDIFERGRVLSTSLDADVPSHGQVRRLAKRDMARTNALHRGTVITNRAGRKARGHRYINLTIEEAGTTFFDGVAEITGLTRNIETGGVTFTWVAADPNIDAWNPATEEGEPAALGDRVAPEPLDAPVITDLVAELDDTGTNARIYIEVTGPDRDDLTWFARWRASGGSIWNEQAYSDIDPGPSVELLTGLVPTDLTIEIEAAYQVGDGRVSPWSALDSVSTSAATLPPGPTTNVSATGGVGAITPAWRNPASINYSYTRSYYGVTNVFGSATALSPDDAASPSAVRSLTFTGISPGTYYVWTRAYSGAGVPAAATIAPSTVVVT